MLHAAWYDAEKFVRVTPSTREDACPLALGDMPCRWLAAVEGALRRAAKRFNVNRCRDGLRRLVHVETLYDGSPQ